MFLLECSFKCGSCESELDNCVVCSDLSSRDLANNCECKTGLF